MPRSRNYAATGGARPRIRRSRAALAPMGERWSGREATAAKRLEARCAGAQRARERARGGRDPQGEREHGAGEDAEREQAEPAAAQRGARAEQRWRAPPGRRRRARSRRWRAPTGARSPARRRRGARRAARARGRRARARPRRPASSPEPAASRQLCARGPHSSAARVWSAPTASSGSSTRARRVREGGASAHMMHRQISAGSRSVVRKSRRSSDQTCAGSPVLRVRHAAMARHASRCAE